MSTQRFGDQNLERAYTTGNSVNFQMSYSGPRAFQTAYSAAQLQGLNAKRDDKIISRPISTASKRSIANNSDTAKKPPVDIGVHEVQYRINPSRGFLDQQKPGSRESRRSGISKEVEIKEAIVENSYQKIDTEQERPRSQLSKSMASIQRLSQSRPLSRNSLMSSNGSQKKTSVQNQSVNSNKSLASSSLKQRPLSGLSQGSRSVTNSKKSEKTQEKDALAIYVRELEELLRFEKLKRIRSEERLKQVLHRVSK